MSGRARPRQLGGFEAEAGPGWHLAPLDRRTFLKLAGMSGAAVMTASAGSMGAPLVVGPSSDVAAAGGAIAELADRLDYDVERIFRFVSDEIAYEPYAGTLRGAIGTLSARSGSSADQAVLLAALFDAAAVPHRFALGRIDGAAVGAIMGTTVVDQATARADVAAAWQPAAGGSGPLPVPSLEPRVQERLARAVADAPRILGWARQQVDDHVATIETALRDSGVAIAVGAYSSMPDLERDRHVWLQLSSGTEWQDVDPCLPGRNVGDALTSPDSTSADLPPELRHRLGFAVVAETVAAGALTEQRILEVSAWADELVGVPIQFLNIRPEGMKAIGVNVPAALEGKTSYLPALVVGEAAYVGGRAFGVGGGTGVFDASPRPGAGVVDGDATAEWLDITITSPGRAPVTVRRAIFDRIGLSARSSGDPDIREVAPIELVDLGPDLPAQYLPAQTEHWLTVSGGRLTGDVLRDALRPPDDQMAFVDMVHAYHLVRDAADLEITVPGSVRTFEDAPNIVSFSVTTASDAAKGPMATFAVDIWHRSYGYLPVSGVPPATNPGIVAGVLSHVAERVLLGDASAVEGVRPAEPLVSVGAVFDAARAQEIPIRALANDSGVAGLSLPPDVLARIRGPLTDGWLVIMPERTVSVGGRERTGWWLVDPATGRTADQMDDGRGAAVNEFGVTLTPAQVAAESAFRQNLWKCVAGSYLVAGGLLDAVIGGALGGLEGAVMGGAGGSAAAAGSWLLAACLAA